MIREIEVGYDFEVAIVDDEWVFRFPRHPGVKEALQLELVLGNQRATYTCPTPQPRLPKRSKRSPAP
jgi:hypothetical protein